MVNPTWTSGRERRPTEKAKTAPTLNQDAASALFGMATTTSTAAAAASTGLDNRGVVSSSNKQTVGLAPTLSQFHKGNHQQPIINPYHPEALKRRRQQEEEDGRQQQQQEWRAAPKPGFEDMGAEISGLDHGYHEEEGEDRPSPPPPPRISSWQQDWDDSDDEEDGLWYVDCEVSKYEGGDL